MSGAAVAARGASAVSKSASRSGWLASLKDDAVSFLKGDNNAPWAILAESVIGCIPVLGQLVDARDIIKGLIEVSAAPASPAAWFNLITALIGLVPGGGHPTALGLGLGGPTGRCCHACLRMPIRLHWMAPIAGSSGCAVVYRERTRARSSADRAIRLCCMWCCPGTLEPMGHDVGHA